MSPFTPFYPALLPLPIPYNVFACVAVWRSAGRYVGERLWADLARIAVVLLAILASAT